MENWDESARRSAAEAHAEILDLDADEIIQQLYNLDRKDIRKVAWEALLISDGPDKIEGDVTDASVVVGVLRYGFKIWSRNGPQGRELHEGNKG